MKIGLSLSFCVRDILYGKVAIEDVTCLITGTCIRTFDEWDEVIAEYSVSYWRPNPEKARQIVNQLRETNRIVQPRVNGMMPPTNLGTRHWIEITDETR